MLAWCLGAVAVGGQKAVLAGPAAGTLQPLLRQTGGGVSSPSCVFEQLRQVCGVPSMLRKLSWGVDYIYGDLVSRHQPK